MEPATEHLLQTEWARLLVGLGCPPGACQSTFADLAGRYREPWRYYHTLDHVAAVLEEVRSLRGGAPEVPALLLAAWFHDAVYDPRAGDNEERSAAYAGEVLGAQGLPEALR